MSHSFADAEYNACIVGIGPDWGTGNDYVCSNSVFPTSGGTTVLNLSEKLRKVFTYFQHSVVRCSMFRKKHLENNVNVACEGSA